MKTALKAVEPQLRREHELAMEKERVAREIQIERMHLEARQADASRTHLLFLLGLIAGFILAAEMLTGAIIVGTHGEAGLAALLAGPSLVTLAGIFVLRRKETSDTNAVRSAQQQVLQAVGES
ncbi:hypothetical protein ACWDBW_09095 [Streptomyces sp. NPDC001107]